MSSSFPAARFPALPLGKEKESPSPDRAAPSDEPSDDVLIARIRTDDSEALGLLFRRYARLVWSIGLRILRNKEEADDLMQDVFLLVRRRASAFDASKGSVRSLLVQICYQRAFSKRRYLVRRNFYSSAEVGGNSTSVSDSSSVPLYDDSLEGHFGRERLKSALDDLSPEQKETLRLYFFEEYTLEEIAEHLEWSYGNVRHHYYRGLAKLRKHAEDRR